MWDLLTMCYLLIKAGRNYRGKRDEEGHRLTVVEEQSAEYASSKLKYLNNDPSLYTRVQGNSHAHGFPRPEAAVKACFSFSARNYLKNI